ncbi:MAG TPA: PAS domain S-box protein [Candidatus Limnocylindria bacterium]|jgi:PAS domain S-box-containing protein|nr:PAS domain S-box protein [Candidatus Limnocylindria bacterium]
MARTLRVLLVEDSPVDAELTMMALEQAGFQAVWRCVETESEYLASLTEDIELVISDYFLPGFDGLRALELFKARGMEIPFIIVTGVAGEEPAAAAMRNGASDFLVKDRLARLGPAVTQALQQCQLRRERTEAIMALRKSDERLKLALAAAGMGAWEWEIQTGRMFWSAECYSITGATDFNERLEGFERLVYKEDRRFHDAAVQRALVGRVPYRAEFRIVRPDGQLRWVSNMGRAEYGPDGRPVRLVGTVHDITERKRAEETRERLVAIVESSSDAIVSTNLAGVVLTWNPGAERVFGYTSTEAIGQPIGALVFPASRPSDEMEILSQVAHSGDIVRFEAMRRKKDGSAVDAMVTIAPIRDGTGRVVGISQVAQDITERKQGEQALRESDERFQQLAGGIHEVFWMATVDWGKILYVSPAYEQIWGRSCESLYANPRSWTDAIHPDDRARVLEEARARQVLGGYDIEYRIVRPNGESKWIHDRAVAVRGADGSILRIAGVAEDISARLTLEAQFRQAQKMEAIGQLAGGIAHDFNNILTAIHANAALMMSANLNAAEQAECVQQVIQAAGRAAGLTRQLLIFGRKQSMNPQNLDLNELVGNVVKMLRRVVGEDVSLVSCLAPKLPLFQGDLGMIEQVLLNLAVNSRDAMPGGGTITIETSTRAITIEEVRQYPQATPGQGVFISVADDGTGIAPEHLPRVFEPFFTTKEVGKGTGLGLATAYGIVKQHRGWITVKSELGKGTTFHIGFPALAAGSVVVKKSESTDALPMGSETILVVEDEIYLRPVIVTVLRRYGYKVLEAVSGQAALDIWRTHSAEIRLLFTDLVMPQGISGVTLAEQLKRENPGLKVIYTSGYSAELSARGVSLPAGSFFLQKPYPPQKLVETVRACLDGRSPD